MVLAARKPIGAGAVAQQDGAQARHRVVGPAQRDGERGAVAEGAVDELLVVELLGGREGGRVGAGRLLEAPGVLGRFRRLPLPFVDRRGVVVVAHLPTPPQRKRHSSRMACLPPVAGTSFATSAKKASPSTARAPRIRNKNVEAGAVFPLLEPHEVGGLDTERAGEIVERQPPLFAQPADAAADELDGAVGSGSCRRKRAMPRNHRSWPEYTDRPHAGQ